MQWLKPFLLTLSVILGLSALWVWAAPMTGNTGKNMQFTGTNEFDIGGILRANSFGLHQLGTDPPPGADWLLYATSAGVKARDPTGNVYGPFGASGGGGTGVGLTARLITTTNITLSGEQVIEGITTSGSRVFVAGQTTQTQNGIYVTASGAWTRASDAATGATFATGTLVAISDGIAGASGNKGTVWMYTSSGSYNTSALTSVKTAYGPSTAAFELAANKNAASGYAGLTAALKQIWTQRGDAATHAAISAPGSLTPTASTMRVSGSGGPVTLTTGNPRIVGCTTSADDGKELTIEGSDATNTLTMPTGNGVKLCGNAGSLTFGLNLGSGHFVCNGATATWRQSNCPDLQQAFNVSNKIQTGSTAATGFQWGDIPNQNYCTNFWDAANSNTPTTRCFVSGVVSDIVHALTATKKFLIKKSDGTTLFSVDNDTGTVTGLTVPRQRLMAVTYPGVSTCPYTAYHWSVVGTNGGLAGEASNTGMVLPGSATVRNLRFLAPANIASGETRTLTVLKNGAATTLTCSVVQGAGVGSGEVSDGSCVDTTHTFTVVAGDTIVTKMACSGSAATNLGDAISMELE